MINSIGHTPDHLSLYLEKDKLIFCVDSINIKDSLLEKFSGVNCCCEIKSSQFYENLLNLEPLYMGDIHRIRKTITIRNMP